MDKFNLQRFIEVQKNSSPVGFTTKNDVARKGDITDEQYDIFMKELKSKISQ